MKSFRIKDNEIQIIFERIPSEEIRKRMKEKRFRWNPASKLWHAPFNDEREALARELTGNLPMQLGKVPETLADFIDSILTSEDEEAKRHLSSLLSENLASELDVYVQAIRDYKNEEKQAVIEKRQQEAVIKAAVSEDILNRLAMPRSGPSGNSTTPSAKTSVTTTRPLPWRI